MLHFMDAACCTSSAEGGAQARQAHLIPPPEQLGAKNHSGDNHPDTGGERRLQKTAENRVVMTPHLDAEKNGDHDGDVDVREKRDAPDQPCFATATERAE